MCMLGCPWPIVETMAKSAREKEDKKAAKVAKRAQRKQTRSQLWQAFNMQRKQDKKLIPLMILALLVPALVLFGLGFLWGGQWLMLFVGILLGITLALWLFTRRLQTSVYDRAAGQAGAAGWALDNLRNGVGMRWETTQAVQINNHMDAVHRVVGLPGVVLVGEGETQRVKPMIAKERKRLARIVGEIPIYDMIAGDGEGQVPLKKLQRELVKLPRNIKKSDVQGLAQRIDALDNLRQKGGGLPKGPMPQGAKAQRGMNRRARRAAERSKKG